MGDRSAFERARKVLSTSRLYGAELATPFTDVFAVSGASLSILAGGAVGQATLGATDAVAARIDELQFDLGEGPCWDALAARHPVLAPDLPGVGRTWWPAFGEAMQSDADTADVASIFAFPLSIGSLDIGAVDLYSATPSTLDHAEVTAASQLADLVAWQVLRSLLDRDTDPSPHYSRREVHQATGMIIAQLNVSAEEASLLLRAHAFAAGRSVRDLATDVVARRIDFSSDGRTTDPKIG